jgi:PIN domain nuclease of toxin-antitoxin system
MGGPVTNLDTHILVFALSGALTPRERRVLAGTTWGISAIVLWELAKLTQLGRIELDLENAEVVRTLTGVHVWPLDLAVSLQSTRLDFSGDPADEIIAATSVVHRVPLLTRDRRIRRSRMVPLA